MADVEVEVVQTAELPARSYQLEMLEKSLSQGNVLVCMDTGSGKTLVAMLRIKHELDHDPKRMVWFVCPTVELAKQQQRALAGFLTAAEIRLLTGKDGPELWSTRDIWNRYLKNVNVVVCTYEPLRSALSHSFVLWDQISLLVVDEAHHASKKHPLNQLMLHYLNYKKNFRGKVPVILGLSASPVMKGQPNDILQIEENMASKIITPTVFRDELLQHSNRPSIKVVSSPPETAGQGPLRKGILKVPASLTARDFSKEKRNSNMVKAVHEDLGQWAAEKLLELLQVGQEIFQHEMCEAKLEGMTSHLEEVRLGPTKGFDKDHSPDNMVTSEKFRTLRSIILKEMKSTSRVVIFAQTRAAVRMLSILLNSHPETREKVISRSVVSENLAGESQWDRIYRQEQATALADLKAGRVNVIVSTTVLEEGIDISSCDLVICFDQPQNLKAFIQRRGRARAQSSSLILIINDEEARLTVTKWLAAEVRLSNLYQTGERYGVIETPEQSRIEPLTDPTTQARLDMDDAISHLYHFCAKLPHHDGVVPIPHFTYEEVDCDQIKCSVLLPGSVDAAVRHAHSALAWSTKKEAQKDASLAAYKRLYDKGLVNEHLLPQARSPYETIAAIIPQTKSQTQAELIGTDEPISGPLVQIAQQWSPWPMIASSWPWGTASVDLRGTFSFYWYPVKLTQNKEDISSFFLCSPKLLLVDDLQIQQGDLAICLGKAKPRYVDSNTRDILLQFHQELLQSAFNTHPRDQGLFDDVPLPALIVPHVFGTGSVPQEWAAQYLGNIDTVEELQKIGVRHTGVVQDMANYGKRYILQDVSTEITCLRFPKSGGASALYRLRSHISGDNDEPVEQYKDTAAVNLKMETSIIKRMPLVFVEQALVLPYILRASQLRLTASEFFERVYHSAILPEHLCTFVEAITTPAACESVNYQRLEFLGDGILKYITTSNLMAVHPHWHEGDLSKAKELFVSNDYLQRATLAEGNIPLFMISDRFRKNNHGQTVHTSNTDKREMSCKTLADVFEAVLAAFYVTLQEIGTLAYLKRLLPALQWRCQAEIMNSLQSDNDRSIGENVLIPPNLVESVEGITNTGFERKGLLLEALTHQSSVSLPLTPSYERIEFLGDALLDLIVTETLFESGLSPARMHSLREATVNRHFQAFCVFSRAVEYDIYLPDAPISGSVSRYRSPTAKYVPQMKQYTRKYVLTDFVRCSPESGITTMLKENQKRFESLRYEISHQLRHSQKYPWKTLISMRSRKTVSDIFEATLAAIYVDSGGCKARCIAFLEVFGIMGFLRHAIAQPDMNLLHPREEIAIYAAGKKVTYEREDVESTEESETSALGRDKASEVLVTIYIDGSKFCSARGFNVEEAETAAADAGLEIFRKPASRDVTEGACMSYHGKLRD